MQIGNLQLRQRDIDAIYLAAKAFLDTRNDFEDKETVIKRMVSGIEKICDGSANMTYEEYAAISFALGTAVIIAKKKVDVKTVCETESVAKECRKKRRSLVRTHRKFCVFLEAHGGEGAGA